MTSPVSTPFLFTAYTVFSVAGMVLVKYAAPGLKAAVSQGTSILLPGLLVAGGAGMYVLGFLLWMVILTRSPLTVAYPIAVGLTMVFSTLCAVLFLRETLTWSAIAGMVLVFLGVVLLAKA
jgi:drug/metabolite transporter (DMT)-like permease